MWNQNATTQLHEFQRNEERKERTKKKHQREKPNRFIWTVKMVAEIKYSIILFYHDERRTQNGLKRFMLPRMFKYLKWPNVGGKFASKKMNVVEGGSTVKRLELQIGLPNTLSQMSLMRIQLLSVWQSYAEIARHLVLFSLCVRRWWASVSKTSWNLFGSDFFFARAVAVRF